MTDTRLRKPNRLAQLVHQPGGRTRDEAVRAAEASLEEIREAVLLEIDATLQRMFDIGRAVKASSDGDLLDELYEVANSIVGMAGVFGKDGLGQISFSLCKAIDQMRSKSRFDPDAVQIHLDSLRLVSSSGSVSGRDQDTLISALHIVVDRI